MARNKVSSTPRAPNRLTRLVRFWRSHGRARALYRAVRWLAERRWLRRWCRFCAVDVFTVATGELKRPRRIPRAFVVRPAEEKDLSALESFFSDPQRVRDRVQRGDVCVIALAKDEICAAVWLALGPKDYREDWDDLRCTFDFPAGVCFTYDGRGTRMGAWGSLMAHLPGYLDDSGVAEVFTVIECDNQNSLDSHKSLRYRGVGLVFCFGVFGLSLCVYRALGRKWRRLPGRIGGLGLGTTNLEHR